MTDKCREEFLKWYGIGDFEKTDDGRYRSITVQSFFECYQHAWNAARQPEQPDAPINQAYEG